LGAFGVVGRTADGVVVRGAKQHVLGAAVVHDLVVVPEGDLLEGQTDAAIAFMIPVNTPGVKIVSVTTAPLSEDDRHFPISREYSMADATVLFDDVVVPNERIFLDGETAEAGSLAKTFGLWERARGAADQADRAELLLGLAYTIADMNGLTDVAHIREKLSRLAVYANLCRAGWESALAHAQPASDGAMVPDESAVYAALAYGTDLYSRMVAIVHDVGGASTITAPTVADYENEATRGYVEKYMSTGNNVRGEDRMKVFHLIRDLTADRYSGWLKVTNQMLGGGVLAQQLAALDHYPLTHAQDSVRAAAHI
jgi:4-hydroxybutyryl-CoA dehydratase/vinylacetyl-CoA-Delta-isomerase